MAVLLFLGRCRCAVERGVVCAAAIDSRRGTFRQMQIRRHSRAFRWVVAKEPTKIAPFDRELLDLELKHPIQQWVATGQKRMRARRRGSALRPTLRRNGQPYADISAIVSAISPGHWRRQR